MNTVCREAKMEVDPTFLLKHFTLFGLEFQPWMAVLVAIFLAEAVYLWLTHSKRTLNG
jgi:hypothetical protein